MTWSEFILNEERKPYFSRIKEVLKNTPKYYPPKNDIYNAFYLTPYDRVKVVLIGQDPYHEENQAHGLAFSVLNQKAPPSLENIFKEMESDLGKRRTNTNLTDLALQGVFLLNTALTVEAGKPHSHAKIGWEIFTENAILELEKNNNVIVYILLGRDAQRLKSLITNPRHFILEASHPSFYSAAISFFGSRIFSKTNRILEANRIKPIKWV